MKQKVPAEYWDLGLEEGSVKGVWYYIVDGVETRQPMEFPLPEDIMDDLEELLGDGNATLTIGKEIKASEDFKTAGSFCSIRLTCNQDVDTIVKARAIGAELALGFAEHGYLEAEAALMRVTGHPDAKGPEPLVVESSPPTPKKTNKDPEEGRKQGTKKRPMLRNKPSFKR